MNRKELLAQFNHGVEPRLRVPAVGVMEEQETLDVRLNSIESNLLGDVFTKGSPRPFDSVCVHIGVIRVDKVFGMVDGYVPVVQPHLTRFVVATPAVTVDDGMAVNVFKDGFGQRVGTAVFNNDSKHFPSLAADTPKYPPQFARFDSSNAVFSGMQMTFVYFHDHAHSADSFFVKCIKSSHHLPDRLMYFHDCWSRECCVHNCFFRQHPMSNAKERFKKGRSGDLELLKKNSLFADYKAVKSGQVYTTGSNFYQQTSETCDFIEDLNKILTQASDTEYHFLKKLD